MRKILLAILLLVPFLLTAQPDFREGYVINNHGDTLRGTIDYRGDLMMGSICRFLDPAGRIQEFSPDSIASYRLNDGKFYVSKDVEGHKFFLEYLVKGLVNLYYLRNDKGDFYFIDKEGERLSAITFTEEHRYDQGVRVNYRSTSHMGLLAYYMQDAPGIKKRVEDLKKPSRSNLMNLVKDYHNTIPGGKERLEFESKKRISNLKGLIGKTPLIKIRYAYKGEERMIFAKAEYLNFTGSIKDRMAYYIMWDAVISGKLKPGMVISEATSGNTGISIVAIGRFLGHDVTIFMPDWMSKERISLLESYGATIRLVSKEEGGFLGSIEMANNLKEKNPDGVFLPLQFDNEMNCKAHYFSTGPEIYNQLNSQGIIPDAFVAGVGTGGTIMGTGRFLREAYPVVKVHPLEPANSPTLSTGHKVGKHRIQGISDEFIPSIVKLNELDYVVAVDDGDSIIMSQMLAKTFGLGLGISSGANFLGAVKLQNEQGPGYNVVTVFADDSKKYLSTDYLNKEPVKSDFLTPDIVLLEMAAIPHF